MAKPELGQKQLCPNDQTKFYDLGRRPAVCPKCDFSFDPEEVVKSRRVRTRTPDYEEAEEKDATAAAVEPDEDNEDEEDTERTPEIDEAADEKVVADDDAEGDKSPPADGIGVDFAEEEDVEEDSADVPFLEDEEEDEDFAEDDIDGLPGEDDETER